MKVGISTATFFTKVLTEDSFSVIKRLGADTCEVFLTTFYEYKDAFAPSILPADSTERNISSASLYVLGALLNSCGSNCVFSECTE